MALGINTNIPSMNAQRNLDKSQNALQKSIQRLSSGLRINSAKDDAAGLAISNRMTAKIRGLDQAVRNSNDGISLAQTAEGALQESTTILQRIRELSVQASNDTATDDDRASLQVEVGQLVDELDRIATSTTFNGRKLLDGTFSDAKFQVGADAGQTVSFSMTSARTSALGSSSGATQEGQYARASVTSSPAAITGATLATSGTLGAGIATKGDLTVNGVKIDATSAGDDGVSTTDNSASAISIAAAINKSTSNHGVVAVANATSLNLGTFTTAAGVTLDTGELTINGVSISGDAADNNELLGSINAESDQTGVVATVDDTNNIVLTAVDGRNIQLQTDATTAVATFAEFDMTAATGEEANLVGRGTVSLFSNGDITIDGNGSTGFSKGTTEATALVTSTNFTAANYGLKTGDLVINGYVVDGNSITDTSDSYDPEGDQVEVDTTAASSDAFSAMSIAHKINNTAGLKDQVVATAKTMIDLGKVGAATGIELADTDFTINGVSVTLAANSVIESDDASGALVGAINAALASGGTNNAAKGMRAYMDDDNNLIIEAKYGQNINISFDGGLTGGGTDFFADPDINVTTLTNKFAQGTVSLTPKSGSALEVSGKNAIKGLVDESAYGTVSKINISSFAGAQKAINVVDSALSEIDDMRAGLGAMQNRFESTISNLMNVSENLSAARGRIIDADFAAETASMTKNQILQQAGVAMLAQSNQLPQQVLSLLQG